MPARSSRSTFPLDLWLLLSGPLVLVVVAVANSSVFRLISFLNHPTADRWLELMRIAACMAGAGIALLAWAKWPQYRTRDYWTVGRGHLPAAHRRIYALSFWLILPAICLLIILLATASRI